MNQSIIMQMIEQYVGMDMLSFRSFISLSVNDFKKLYCISYNEKQLLVDKFSILSQLQEWHQS
jgi:hypothetical protein